MRKESSYYWICHLLIVIVMAGSLSGCASGGFLLERTTGLGARVVTRQPETRKTSQVAYKEPQLQVAADNIGLEAFIVNQIYYKTEERWRETRGLGIFTRILTLGNLGLLYSYKIVPDWKYWTMGISTADVLLALALIIITSDTGNWLDGNWLAYTSWKPGTEVMAGEAFKIPHHPVFFSLPQFQWQKSYSTNAAGVVKVPLSELTSAVSSIPNPEDVLYRASIDVNVSTEIDGKALKESATLSSMDVLQAFRDAARQEQRHRQEAPADLVTEIAFSDETDFIPNQALDAGERSGKLKVTVRNQGRGLGFGVTLSLQADNPDVKLDTAKSLGDIAFNEENSVTFPIETSLQAKDGFVNIVVETKEKRGFDAQKQQIRIPVVHLAEPKLEITSLELNDKQLGNAVGNGNGIPENNETIEIVAFIKNSGVGNAIGTKLDLVDLNSGIEVLEQSADLGTIRPNQTVKGALLFHIPRTYKVEAGSTLDYKVRIEDVRGADTAEQTKTVAMSAQQPILAYSIQAPATLHNGRTAPFQITPKNTGTLVAKGVNLQLSAQQGAKVTPESVSLGDMAANTSGLAQPFTVTLPRTYQKQNLTLDIKMTQADFVGLTKTETYPVELIAPELILTDRFFDSSGDGKIEQGERVELEITVTNKGKLEALNTVLEVTTSKPLVRIEPESKSIGTLPENTTSDPMKFTLTVPRGVESGALPIMLEVTQTDFPAVTKTLEYTIYEVGAATTVVEARKPSETPQPEAFRGNQPPTILPNVKDNQTIYTPTYQLQVSMSDDRGLTSAQVRLNGRVVYDSQTDPSAADKLSASAGRLLSFTQPLTTLKEGANELVLSAIDNDNERSEITIRLNYNLRAQVIAGLDNPSDVDVDIPTTGMSNPDAIAVVIGNRDYLHFPVVDFAIRDAQAMREYLIKMLGYRPENVILIENATKGRFDELFGTSDVLEGELYNRVKQGASDVFIFYSGHGLPALKGKQHGYMVPIDCQEKNFRLSGYAMETFYQNVNQIPARSITIVLDACFSGKSIGGDLITQVSGGPGTMTSPIYDDANNPLSRSDVLIFASANGDEWSNWYPEKRHGLFTYFFLKGLRGDADGNGDKTILASELDRYISDEGTGVPRYARLAGKEQTPVTMGDTARIVVRLK